MIGAALGWLIGGLMVLGWIIWLLLLILGVRVQTLFRGPHGAKCWCEECVREMERLARIPTPCPKPRAHFRNAAAWARYQNARETLIERKRHWGLSPDQIDPFPPVADPEPAWWTAHQAKHTAAVQRRYRARMRAHQVADIKTRLLRRQPVTKDELLMLWPNLFH